jgi:hypothetical protein
VSPTPTRTTQEYMCKNLKQDIKVSNTPFSKNQAWKHDFKHGTSSLHPRDNLSLIFVA